MTVVLKKTDSRPGIRPEVKARWLADLRSGKFKQGMTYLKQVDSSGATCHCQAGVLVEQAVEAGVVTWEHWGREFWLGKDAARCFPPKEVREFIGLHEGLEAAMWEAIDMNDRGVPFEEIAEFVERNF